jgi:hypothetical protein
LLRLLQQLVLLQQKKISSFAVNVALRSSFVLLVVSSVNMPCFCWFLSLVKSACLAFHVAFILLFLQSFVGSVICFLLSLVSIFYFGLRSCDLSLLYLFLWSIAFFLWLFLSFLASCFTSICLGFFYVSHFYTAFCTAELPQFVLCRYSEAP